jgi:hypothetical protein
MYEYERPQFDICPACYGLQAAMKRQVNTINNAKLWASEDFSLCRLEEELI